MPGISLRRVSKTYRQGPVEFRALHHVSLEVDSGEFMAIVGPSGSGKSTLLHVMGGLDRPTTGTVRVGASDLTALSDRALADFRNREVGFVFQSFHLIPHLTLYENVRLPLIYGRRRLPEPQAWIRDVLTAVGLQHRLRHRPAELSGGEHQRAAIARALVNDPGIVLADEPTGNLDSATGKEILRLFSILHEAGKTIVLVTHDEKLSRRATRILTLQDGHLV